MDRFSWSTGGPLYGEKEILKQSSVRIYDGDEKTSYDDGSLILTTHQIIWRDSSDFQICISVPLCLVVFCEKQSGGIGRSAKLSVHLQAAQANRTPGPVSRSRYDYVRFSFKNGGESEFHTKLQSAMQTKEWEKTSSQATSSPVSKSSAKTGPIRASGIVGIERKIEENRRVTDKNISVAFQDLTKLMEKAKEMVSLSSNIANKIKDKKGDITDDETVKFKSYLLSLGIPNPVTKETHGSGTHYHMQLAHEIASLLKQPLEENAGIMLLSDAYCRINRARGMELLSPEDLLNACRMLDNLKLHMKLREFETGVLVLQLDSHSDEKVISQTTELVDDSKSLSAQELANLVSVSVLLAKERLLLAERAGKLCRDDSDEGLRFYPNLFAQPMR
uniref:Vacuolar protein-sorting-associated protein 36 n=1 Tax=Phallusia mammillata TaxID=59560 RepID=A0A6F9DWX4_9ASCI|nr:vacuolar protein-sorting-associated protein 36-like [Phallusia mammillata]